MIPPVTSIPPIDVHQPVQPPTEVKPDPHAQTPPVAKSGELSHDRVTLKTAGQPDHDGDRD